MVEPRRFPDKSIARLALELRALRNGGGAARVMIVEDDALIALAIEDALIDDGFEICGVFSAEEPAIASARSLQPEFAVVDVRLAPGDGRHVARVLSKECGSVVLLASAEDITTLEGVGAPGVLSKPYDAAFVGAALVTAATWLAGLQVSQLPPRLFSLIAS